MTVSEAVSVTVDENVEVPNLACSSFTARFAPHKLAMHIERWYSPICNPSSDPESVFSADQVCTRVS